MPHGMLRIATIAAVIAAATGLGAQAQEAPSQQGSGPGQGSIAGQAQQLLNGLGEAVQGTTSKAAGGLGGMLNSLGLGGPGSAPTPTAENRGTAPEEVGGAANGPGGVAPGGAGGDATNGPCGYYGHPPCKIAGWNACALLTADDLAAVSGESWTQQGSGPMRPLAGAQLINECTYDGQGEHGDMEITTVHSGGRAQFDKHAHARDLRSLSGVGDEAYLNVVEGGAHVLVIQNGTYFEIRLQSHSPNPNLGSWAVASARKAADRIKSK